MPNSPKNSSGKEKKKRQTRGTKGCRWKKERGEKLAAYNWLSDVSSLPACE